MACLQFESEPDADYTSGFRASTILSHLVGFVTPDKKGELPTTSLHLLGSNVAIGTSSFEAAATPVRVEKIHGHIAHH